MNKRGISTIIGTIIMVALVMAAGALIWGVINSSIEKQTEGTQSCFGNFGKITLERRYTCYDSTNDRMQFAINIGDIDVDEMIILISSIGETKSFKLSNTASLVPNLVMYNGTTNVWLPPKNSGITYNATINTLPSSVTIAPIIGGNQCDIADEIVDIDDCKSFV